MRAKFILNPSAGKQMIQKNTDKIIGNLVLNGTVKYVDVFTTQKKLDALEEVRRIKKDEFDMIIAVGGDGTLNEVVNGLLLSNNKIPIAVLPAGTVNDFANWIGVPNDIKGFCHMIAKNNRIQVDAGKCGDYYFVNVAAGGLLTDVGYKVSSEAKTVLGKFAYYVEGMKEIPKQLFRSINLKIQSTEFNGQEDVLMFMITNTPRVGGLKKMSPKAKVDDGLLDVCIIRKTEFTDFFPLFLGVMKGEHIYHPNVIYLQTSKIELNCSVDMGIDLDLDGEQWGKLPVTIEAVPKAIEFIVP